MDIMFIAKKGIDKKPKMCGKANQIYTFDWRSLSYRNTVISSKTSLICLFES